MGKMIPIAQPIIGEEEKAAVLAVLDSGNLVQGAKVKEFEDAFAAYCGARYAVAVSSGTAALHLALLAHGIDSFAEVITTPFSFISTANAILHCGAWPKFADVSLESFNIDPSLAGKLINRHTRAILPVHLYGNPADIEALWGYGLPIIEDACQAHGAMYRGQMIGSLNTTCFSFYATKNMVTGEGGMVTTNNPVIEAAVRTLRSHGVFGQTVGFNYRMTDIQAAIGIVQLRHLSEVNEARRKNACLLTDLLSDLLICPTDTTGRVYHQYTVRIERGRDEVLKALNEAGISARVYYDPPIHKMYPYSDDLFTLPHAELLANQALSLPVHPGVTGADIEQMAGVIRCALA